VSRAGASTPQLSSALRRVVTLIDERQPGYAQHANSAARLTRMVGLQFDLNSSALESLRCAALLHDAGSLRLPFGHTGSRWRLPAEERRVWETHPTVGVMLARVLDLSPEVERAVLGHHERWDGSGYPYGLSGTQVPLTARILGVCDTYEEARSGHLELDSQRLTEAEALARLRNDELRRFDPDVVLALGDALGQEREVSALTGVFG
jgi:HD-GYP domain-containing protein (c-di-GMP phosphodiesterase class II)